MNSINMYTNLSNILFQILHHPQRLVLPRLPSPVRRPPTVPRGLPGKPDLRNPPRQILGIGVNIPPRNRERVRPPHVLLLTPPRDDDIIGIANGGEHGSEIRHDAFQYLLVAFLFLLDCLVAAHPRHERWFALESSGVVELGP